jgi:NAD(P) transhydrogenase subunit alpha
MLKIFVPKEIRPGETRVAAIPDTIKKYLKAGFSVKVETQAGERSGILDKDYTQAGAEIVSEASQGYSQADIVLKVMAPSPEEISEIPEKATLISFLLPHLEMEKIRALQQRQIQCFSMNLIPRTTLAQKMDALSSQSNIAGYKSVLLAADTLGKLFPLLMTAAGTINPAKVVVMGAGVAGLQAIATAKRLGAVVEASDVRPAAKEQVESLGAKFIEVPFDKDVQDQNGYAKEASPEFLKRQAEEVAKRVSLADIVITTALIPGKKAPLLITEDMVRSMKPGSVIVDMAAEQGGNCALCEPNQRVVRHGVTIIGETNLPALVPVHASEMYAKNVQHFLLNMVTKEGEFSPQLSDEIVAKSLILQKDGNVVHEPTRADLQKEKQS